MALVAAALAVGCGTPGYTNGTVGPHPGGGGGAGGGGGSSGDGGLADGGRSDGGGLGADGGSPGMSCEGCDPTLTGSCPSAESCLTENLTTGTAYVCGDPASGQTGCAFCTPSDPQNGGCPNGESCQGVTGPSEYYYLCEPASGDAGSDAGV